MNFNIDIVNSTCSKAGIPFDELEFGSNSFVDNRGKPTINIWVQWRKETQAMKVNIDDAQYRIAESNPGKFIPGLIKNLSNNLLQREESLRKQLNMIEEIKSRITG